MDTAMWKWRACRSERRTVGSEEGRWRSTRQEQLAGGLSYYIKRYERVPELRQGLHDYFYKYNQLRLHQSLDYCTPAEVHFGWPT